MCELNDRLLEACREGNTDAVSDYLKETRVTWYPNENIVDRRDSICFREAVRLQKYSVVSLLIEDGRSCFTIYNNAPFKHALGLEPENPMIKHQWTVYGLIPVKCGMGPVRPPDERMVAILLKAERIRTSSTAKVLDEYVSSLPLPRELALSIVLSSGCVQSHINRVRIQELDQEFESIQSRQSVNNIYSYLRETRRKNPNFSLFPTPEVVVPANHTRALPSSMKINRQNRRRVKKITRAGKRNLTRRLRRRRRGW